VQGDHDSNSHTFTQYIFYLLNLFGSKI